ncbi:hypothetical protein ACP4OV_029478 [Aristida adscensionis]
MDPLPLPSLAPSKRGRALDTCRAALDTVATGAAYSVLVRSMARQLLPGELRAAARWCVGAARARLGLGKKERNTVVIRRQLDGGENHLFGAARAYLAARMNPRAMRRFSLARSRAKEADGSSGWTTLMCMEPGGSTQWRNRI